MSDLRDAAQQALEAWDGGDVKWFANGYQVMDALRAALTEEALQRLTDANQEIEAVLGKEPVPKSTWQKLYEAAIDQRNEAVALNQELLEALKYHQEQTRPIERTCAAIARAEGKT